MKSQVHTPIAQFQTLGMMRHANQKKQSRYEALAKNQVMIAAWTSLPNTFNYSLQPSAIQQQTMHGIPK